MRLESVIHGPGFATAVYGPLHLSVWDTATTIDQARSAASNLATLGRTEEHILMMSVLGPSCPPPDSAVREVFATELNRLTGRIAAVANIVEGQGFRAAALRGVLTGLALVIRSAQQQRTCASVDEGGHFLAAHSGGRLTAAAISRAVIQLRPT